MKQYIHIFIILLMMIFLLISCVRVTNKNPKKECPDSSPIHDVIYEPAEIIYKEDEGISGFLCQMEKTSVGQITFLFEEKIEDNERNMCIDYTLELYQLLPLQDSLTIYLFSNETFPGSEIRENTLYTHLQDWNSIDYICLHLLALYGSYCHYGLIYGYACTIATRLPDFESPPNINNIALETLAPYYELNLLCFSAQYTPEKSIETAKTIAYDFTSGYLAQYGESNYLELLKNSQTLNGYIIFCNTLKDYYSLHGFTFSFPLALYRYGGFSFDYVVLTKYGEFFISKDWKDRTVGKNPLVYDSFLHANYPDIQSFFITNLNQLALLETHLGDIDLSNVKVFFVNKDGVSSNYSKKIYIENVSSLMHEYIHVYTRSQWTKTPPGWAGEGICLFYEAYLDNYYADAFLTKEWNNEFNSLDEDLLFMMQQLTEMLQRPFDASTDRLLLYDFISYYYRYEDPNYSRISGASFCHFLTSQYGEAVILSFLFNDSRDYSIFDGNTEAELYRSWFNYLLETYGTYNTFQEWKANKQ